MSHEIETLGRTRESASFVSARVHAWHGLGVVLPSEFDAEDAMGFAQLGGWNVRKVPVQTCPQLDPDGVSAPVSVPDWFATVRTNPVTRAAEPLGMVGADYTVIQNEEHADVLDAITDESGAHFETAGSLRGGRRVFVSMKLPETMTVGGSDRVDLYLIATNSHDGSSAFRLIVSPVRVVCANTLAAAIKGAQSSFSIRHTSGAKASISQAREALRLTWRFTDAFQAEADRMIEQQMTDDEFSRIVAQVWPTHPESTRTAIADDRLRTLRLLRSSSQTLSEDLRGSRWGAYQVITEYIDHYAPTRGRKTDQAVARAERAAIGAGPALKVKAFDLLSVR